MSQNDNPYASPRAAVPLRPIELEADCPELPLVIRPSVAEVAFSIVFGTMLAFGSAFSVRAAIVSFSFVPTFPLGIAAAVIAVASFAGSIIFLSSTQSKLVVDMVRLRIRGTANRSINYGDIESWHRHPATGSILVLLKGKTNSVSVPNWPISDADSEKICAVLRKYAGMSKTLSN